MKLSINGNPLIGLYIKLCDEFAVVGVRDKKAIEMLRELGVEVVYTTIAGSELVGAMLALNSNGALLSNHAMRKEIERIKKKMDVKIVETRMTCLGNIALTNDSGAIVHPEAEERIIENIRSFLDVEVSRGTIGGIKTVGMAGVATNNGALLNPNANEWEIKRVEEVLGVEALTGTVNFGSDMVGTGLVANSRGYIVGEDTTGFELGVIEEALGFI